MSNNVSLQLPMPYPVYTLYTPIQPACIYAAKHKIVKY